MLGRKNHVTVLLVIIVITLFIGVGVAMYYVFDLDWFEKKPVDIYKESQTCNENIKLPIEVKKEIKYDISRRTYNLLLKTDELKLVVYKNGTVGITMIDNEKNKQVEVYKEIINKEVELELKNIIRAYQVEVSNNSTPNNCILLLDVDGNLYELLANEIAQNGKYKAKKIEGIAKIIDIRQITNEGLTDNVQGINVVAIDENSNELLLTQYLIKD